MSPDTQKTNEKDKYIVPGLERGLRLLCEFNRREKTLSPPELASRLDVPRSTVFRLLATLESMGFVERVEGGREYRLGMAVLRLGFEYLASFELNELGQPIIARLTEKTGYTSNLVVRDESSIVYVAKVSPPTTYFVSSINVGSRLPVHATILGHVLLQDMSLAELRQMYPQTRLEQYSERTPKTVVDLFDMIQKIKGQPYTVGEGFFEISISTIAAPVRDKSGHIVAAVGLTIPSAHIESSSIGGLASNVIEAAADISRLLGYAPPLSLESMPEFTTR